MTKENLGRYRNPISLKFELLVRRILVMYSTRFFPTYLVNEYPKSGGSWVGQILSEYLNVPFPRNQMPPIKPCILHGHYAYDQRMRNVFLVVRDGRDVMVSFYYHSLFKNEKYNAKLVDQTRREVPFRDYENIRANLPAFIEYKFLSPTHPRMSWSQFVSAWINQQHVAVIRYEDMLINPTQTIANALLYFDHSEIEYERLNMAVERFSFENQAGRKSGSENNNSFLRKGIAGDWKNHFSVEAKEMFDEYAGEQLIQLGYETDRSWISRK